MVKLLLLPVIFVLVSSGFIFSPQFSEEEIMRYFLEGNFLKAEQLISETLKSNPDKNTQNKLEIIRAKMDRIRLDFSKSEAEIKAELHPYFPELTDDLLRTWEESGKLEMRLIDSKRRYFKNAVPNLFRVDKKAAEAKEIKDGKTIDPLEKFCLEHTSEKVKAIYYWIDNNINWASALEYSTFECIPEYVLKNRKGDCGMQTLLFMSLARFSGIPCKWQSGWMLHPGEVNLHDWCEVYYEGVGWVPLDQSFGLQRSDNQKVKEFYISGIDGYRLIINDDFSREFEPPKKYFRSEPIDFQRGELEWSEGNIYFDKWNYKMDVKYMKTGK